MKILIRTKINKNYLDVFSKFDQHLFEALNPPLIKVSVERFDGCKKGHEVHLRMKMFGVLRQKWISHITADEINEHEAFFVDEGASIPPPLKSWKHVHRIQKIDQDSCYIIDDIDYSSGNKFIDKVLFPALYSMFFCRKPIYKRELS